MKKTMKKTSTFFRKLGSKQSSSDQLQTHTRPPLPNFTDELTIQSTHISQEGAFPSPPLPPLPPKSPTKRTSHHKSDDEHENLQRTLNDFASVYARLQLDPDITDSSNKEQRRSKMYMKLNANKSMPDIGRLEYFNMDGVSDTKGETFDKQIVEKRSTVFEYSPSENKKQNTRKVTKGRRTDSEENIPIAKLEDVPLALQLKPASPVPFSSSDDDKTSSLLSTTNPGFPSFTSPTPSRPTSIGTSQDNKSQNSLFSPGSLMAEAEEKGMSTTAQVLAEKRNMLTAYKNSKNEPQEETEMTFSAGSLMAAAEEKGLFNKPSRSDLDSMYSDSCVSLKSPKRPEKRLPEIPRTTSPPSSPPLTFVSTTSTDRGRQSSSIASSCYETASGSTATLHTAPPSPTTEIDGTIVGSPTIELTIPALTERLDLNDESTPKIHVDEAILASPVESVDTVPGVPEERDEEEYRWAQARNAAKRCFDDNETFMKKEKVTEFLGGTKDVCRRALKCYMEYFDFTGLRLDNAFRRLCGKLYIKGETQQVDRVLEAFSQRYWECNPKTVYGSADTVHAIAYSILLLNTDLHIAEVPKKMSQKQFIRNTMATVHAQATIALSQTSSPDYEDDQSTIASIETTTTGTSATARPRRSASIRSWMSNPNASFTSLVHFGSSVSPGYSRQWDSEMESLLKEMYSAIKSNMIQQPRLSTDAEAPQDATRLSVSLQRSMSHLGHPNTRINVLRKGLSAASLKSRINGRNSASSSGNGSDYDQNSMSRRSSYQTLQAALSNNHHHGSSTENGHTYENSSDQNLTGTEDDSASVADSTSTSESLELYLSGAPFAKEGLLVKKHYWEAANKRAKDNKWKETFVVVEKGELKMYKLESSGSSNGEKGGSKIVGGGNWMANAILLGELSLRHTISSALPPPGYNRSRPYVLALSLSQGGLYFFQCGTAELVDEWVATCNYWAARSSKEPLTGGVSNMDYGWGRCIEPYLDGSMTDMDDQRSIMSDGKSDSRSDVRSVLSGGSGFSSDKIIISEWKAPMPPLVSSMLDEESQLAALKKHMIDLENELEEHKHYREPMLKLFPSRSTNYAKVTSNWERKSQWLLHEIVKYSTYIECLENSMSIRQELRRIKEAERDKVPTLATPEDEEEEKARRRAEQRARNRESIKLLHRATWQPGDGLSLNLPTELFGGAALSDIEDD